jgi:hypothetical protein
VKAVADALCAPDTESTVSACTNAFDRRAIASSMAVRNREPGNKSGDATW